MQANKVTSTQQAKAKEGALLVAVTEPHFYSAIVEGEKGFRFICQ